MKFNVAASDGVVTSYEGQYTINDSGILTIQPLGGHPLVMSPVGWLSLEITKL
jgi:hypothetical protein